MYSLANPSVYGIAELAMLLVSSLLLIRTSLWLMKNMGAH
jgi:hypothetical protein